VAQEELLGPVATVTAFDGESEAVRLANDVSYGLAASLWTGDPARGHRLAPLLEAATVEINVRQTSLPGARQLGLEGLEPYLEPKSVLVDKEGSAGEPGEP
jgi:aldehyde dehydrogenase (NAD+)